MENHNVPQISPIPPLLYSTVLHNGGWDVNLDTENRIIHMAFYPQGMPFIRLLEFNLPSLAFVQFYQQLKSIMDRLSNAEETTELPPQTAA